MTLFAVVHLFSTLPATPNQRNIFPKQPLFTCLFCLLLTLFCSQSPVYAEKPKAADLVADNQPIDLQSVKYKTFFKELIDKHQLAPEEITTLFSELTIDKRVLELMDKQWEGKPYYEYYPLFITPGVIREGKNNLNRHNELFDQIEEVYGVNREVIVAIWAIESRFGSNQGGFGLFRTLNTLFDAYPRRSDFFRKELINFILLCRQNGLDPLEVRGSYAGAFGQAQFMPSSYLSYGVDFDGDDRCDLIHSMPDIFASIANYLKRFGWVLDAPVFAEIGNSLQSTKLIATHLQGRSGRLDWRYVASTQDVSIPRPPNNGKLSIVGLELSPAEGSGMRYVAGYQNFQAITEYNHSHKYAMAVSEMAKAFTK